MNSLVIVESPTKARTIGRFLGDEYTILATVGHVRDLPDDEIGVEVDNSFTPDYRIVGARAKTIASIKEAASEAGKIFLATDPDREGEAISWHISEAANLSRKRDPQRVVFHEITKTAVQKAFADTRPLDMDLVNAQQARRVLDRLVGYKVSPVLWSKIKRGLSAGRVQSVALRLIAEREDEILAFKPIKYWFVLAKLTDGENNLQAVYKPPVKQDKVNSDFAILDEKTADKVAEDLKTSTFKITKTKSATKERFPPPPFTTSTLQQAASNRLRVNAQRTMRIAQSLYEGIKLERGAPTGLITYMRTDSVTMASSALFAARDFIKKEYGDLYTSGPRRHKTKSRNAQEAHEAIRPTRMDRTPKSITKYLDRDQLRLYELIWSRAIASQMTAMQVKETELTITAQSAKNQHELTVKGSIVVFDGWSKAYSERRPENAQLAGIKKGDTLQLTKDEDAVNVAPKETLPPPRYNEAGLIRIMEEKGIGRPSTYAAIVGTINKRDYVRLEKGYFVPTPLGNEVVRFLRDNFLAFMDIKFTADMEENLDKVARGSTNWVTMLQKFYKKLSGELTKAESAASVERSKIQEISDKHCPKCERPMEIKKGRFGTFLGCSGYPECKTTQPLTMGIKCPKCDKHELVRRRNRNGNYFYGCSGYPDCDFLTNSPPFEKTSCSECGRVMGRLYPNSKSRRLICLNPNCAKSERPPAKKTAQTAKTGKTGKTRAKKAK